MIYAPFPLDIELQFQQGWGLPSPDSLNIAIECSERTYGHTLIVPQGFIHPDSDLGDILWSI